jgi:hypothetical protein
MHQRSIVGASKTGSISRLQARTAVKAVKMAKSTGGVARKSASSSSKAGRFVSASVLERYLGHFGVSRSKTGAKKASGPKNSAATRVQGGGPKTRLRGTRT